MVIKMKVAFYTLGCKVNQYETEEMTELMQKNGFEVVSSKTQADIYIINSCTVTAESTRKTRQAVRRFKQKNPDCVTVLTGCVPQAFPNEANSIIEADIIIGNKTNLDLPEAIEKYILEHERLILTKEHKSGECYRGNTISKFEGHTRAFVKIQDGCDRFCSYCAIPYARGRSRSKPIEDIRHELETLGKSGFTEVVFVGINLSAYGRDLGLSLTDAVIAAENTEGIERIRLGSLEPDHIDDKMLDCFAGLKKFCPQFHISLQSGCDSTLKRMNRHYISSEYEELCNKIRSTFPDASITTDIITGFPGETPEDFDATCKFVEKIRFEKVHVFPYSIREGTKAAKMENQIKNEIKSKRASELSELSDKIRDNIFKSYIGKEFSVLFEANKNGLAHGYTKNYTPVSVKTDKNLTGQIHTVKIISAENGECKGKLL